ncbi:MAG TPA: hypothetical protein VIS06_15105, partial [Mycobacteriales bacterium]
AVALTVGMVTQAGVASAAPGGRNDSAGQSVGAPAGQTAALTTMSAGGRGAAARPRVVNLADQHAMPQITTSAQVPTPLGRDGRPVSLPVRPSHGRKVLSQLSTPAGAPNLGRSRAVTPAAPATPRVQPTTVHANFDGVNQTNSNCGGCQPPDVNAAVGTTQIAETVNTRLAVYNKTGSALCGTSLGSFFATSARLFAPRIQYDNLFRRYTLSVGVIPASSTATPRYLVAASRTDNACGRWFVYTVTFSGALFPAGTRVDFPYLGQDRRAVLSSSNNFRGVYLGSAAWSIPKSALYAGGGFTFTAFNVAFSTAPVTVAGIPTFATTNTYFLASVPGTGYRLYRMTNSAGPGTSLVLQADINSPFTAPTRRVNQPGTGTTLDPGDGRISSDPVQDGNFVWFTHGIDLVGFPAIRYGAISVVTNTPFVAIVFKSGTSDDFNPSIGVADAGSNLNRIWLNWAYTDTPVGVPVTDTTNGVGPGEGVPSKVGGLNLVTGVSTNINTRFGDYSSVAVDPTGTIACPAGRVAVVAQEYFGPGGVWRTRIARLGFC